MSSRVASFISHMSSIAGGRNSIPPVNPDGVFPQTIVEEVFEKELENLTGRSGLVRTIIQVSCWDKDYESAWATREAVKAAAPGFTGTAAGQTIQAVNFNTGAYLHDGPRELHQLIARFFVWWDSA